MMTTAPSRRSLWLCLLTGLLLAGTLFAACTEKNIEADTHMRDKIGTPDKKTE